jgi:hypothetical protein
MTDIHATSSYVIRAKHGVASVQTYERSNSNNRAGRK